MHMVVQGGCGARHGVRDVEDDGGVVGQSQHRRTTTPKGLRHDILGRIRINYEKENRARKSVQCAVMIIQVGGWIRNLPSINQFNVSYYVTVSSQ